jgi:hypothetical protein
MRSISYIYKLAVVVLFALGVHGCKKAENNINNNQIIIKPYSLFAVDSFGRMERTNDGKLWDRVAENGGNAGRAIATSGNNIIWVMDDQFAAVSANNENQFNGIKHFWPNPDKACNQSMILNVPAHGRIYMAGNDGHGIIYSDTNGRRGTWFVDNAFDAAAPFSRITSLAILANGRMAAYDYVGGLLFMKNGRNDFWYQVTVSDLPTGGKFFLTSFNNKLVMADSTGVNGVWYSDNEGRNWAKYSGIPDGAYINCMRSAFGQVLLVGTAQYGIFSVTNGTQFKPVNNGLTSGANVRNITAKDDIYKNEQVVQYIYAATDKGIFRSIDLGQNWIMVKPGNYVLIY